MSSPPRDPGFVDIEGLAHGIRARIESALPGIGRASGPDRSSEISMPAADRFLEETALGLRVGQMPEMPPTLRGRAGRRMVDLVRRSLFWLLPQLQHFHNTVAQAIRDEANGIRQVAARVAALQARTERENAELRAELERLRRIVEEERLRRRYQSQLRAAGAEPVASEPLDELDERSQGGVILYGPVTAERLREAARVLRPGGVLLAEGGAGESDLDACGFAPAGTLSGGAWMAAKRA